MISHDKLGSISLLKMFEKKIHERFLIELESATLQD